MAARCAIGSKRLIKRGPKMKGKFCERTVVPAKAFDKRSFRWSKRKTGWALVGCKKGGYQPRLNKCKVGTFRPHKILTAS